MSSCSPLLDRKGKVSFELMSSSQNHFFIAEKIERLIVTVSQYIFVTSRYDTRHTFPLSPPPFDGVLVP